VVIGYANNDGQNEVVVGIDSNIANEVRMYENKSGGWVETNISDVTAVYSLAVGDANNDGKKEVVIGLFTGTNELRMYENKSGGWVETNISDVVTVNSVVIGDANRDGQNEVVVGMASTTNELRMYETTSTTTSVPLGAYILRTSSSGFSDIRFTCA
jgi:hypothetical protein